MSAKNLRSRGINTVQRGSQYRLGSSNKGSGHPRQVGIQPKVVRGDALTPILPKGMDSGMMIDESAGGDRYKF